MKKILFLSLFCIGLMATSANAQRFGTTANADNTGRTLTYAYSTKTYATPMTLKPNASQTWFSVDSLTGVLTVNLSTSYAQKCDEVTLVFVSDSASAGHVVTFGTGIAPSATTLTVDKNQRATWTGVFMKGIWIEKARAKE